ncbi:family 78 glycoside hydrolase catalytic domain [Nocardioides sp. URHA0020]|uniref:family 78 glycoside hydrolase catalytic domain n=1 Tax=Nocardioides sp. URHA0020 TaxID=1380392 RepID=UPI0009DDE5DD|nr:family 78 glycoside hydrolase catalytic domain [Nocardioides sp. URHA0020]
MALAAGLSLSVPAVLVSSSAVAAAAPAPAALTVTGLQTNGRTEPLGIPGAAPSLGWRSQSTARGVVQSAYQVRVASSEDALADADVWDSGKVDSDEQADVEYGGPDLTSGTRYVWQVKVWDGAGEASAWSEPATFETGLLDAGDWDGSDWIGKSAGGEIDRWADYTADIDFDLDQQAIGVFVRAKDTANAYMWQISTADGTGVPKFRPHKRVGNSYQLLGSLPITSMSSAQLLEGTHRLSVTVDGSTITTVLDGTQIDQRTDATFTKGFVGFRQDFANDIDESADIKAVKVTAKNGDVLLDTDFTDGNPFTGGTVTAQGLHVADRKDVLWRSPDANKPLLRKEFTTEPGKTIESARVYASAHGVYELELNGDKVGDQFLAPGSTDYRKRIQSQTYDITDQVRAGDNAIGAELGDGWWAGKVGMWGPGMFGSSLGLIAQVRIDYTDGTQQVVGTDDSWTSHFGPYAAADNIDGETYDANAEQPGWDQPAFDDADWHQVTVAGSDTAKLVPQPDEPVRVTGERPALTRVASPGVANGYIYDLGQNMVGVARMRISGTAGQTVKFRYAEELRANGAFYVGNLRAAKVTDYYTFKESGTVEYTPKFTQHGFRYIEISGAATPPETGDVTGVVWGSDLTATGDLQTSDAMLNQLVSNISWGQRGNFLSIPTDTPARDERLGWTGDINVFAPTASYLRDTRAFLSKWTTDLRDSAYDDGNLPGIAPSVPTIDLGSGLGWSDSAITVPYASFHAQGDRAIVRQNYAAMQKFFAFVRTGAGADLIDSARGNWNDWLNLDDNTGVDVLGTAYYAEDARMLSEMAAAIGEDDDAAEYAALSGQIRDAFTAKLVAADGTVDGNSQTAYAMALGMDLVTDPALRAKVAQRFVAKLKTSDYHLTTGFLGTPWLLPALTSIDRTDLAYTMILKKDYPSWGYEIEHGATTMWERWNSIGPDGSFGDEGMNSFNHYAYGAVGDWMYQNIGAIKALEPGYRKIQVKPAVGGGLTHGSGHYDSVYGAIDTDWSTTGDDLSLEVEVPVNTTAEVVVPAGNQYAVTEGGHLLADVDGVTDVAAVDGSVTVTVGSGHYEFEVTAANERLGAIIGSIDAVRAHLDDLVDSDDLEASDAEHLDGGLAGVRGDVSSALLAVLAGDPATGDLQDALAGVQALRGWLAGSDVDQAVRTDLHGRLAQIEAQAVRALTVSLGIQVALPPVSGSVLPGTTVTGTVDVTNNGTGPVTGLEAAVSVDGWGTRTATRASLAVGETAQLPISFEVPKHQLPGGYDAALSLTFTVGGQELTLTDTTADWAAVVSGLTIGSVTATMGEGDPTEHATVKVPVTNEGTTDITGHVVVTLPTGWKSVPSDRVTVPAGGTVTADVPVVVPLDFVAGAVAAEVELRRAGARLVTTDAEPVFALATPPTGTVVDHVDFGDTASESAHDIQASASSGTNTEAGLTRRYANSASPGAWYSATVDVTPDQPFVLRAVETFDGARTKKYHVYVDGTLVKTQLVPRTETGTGTKVYDLLVDDPAVLANDGNVRVKFEYPTDASGFYDPSIADLWVLPVAGDTQAPDVSALAVSGTVGDDGWYRSDVAVAVSAADNRDDAPLVETGDGETWQEYVGPVTVSGEGKHELSYRASDAAENTSGSRTLPVWIDQTAPQTTLTATRGAGVAGADSATLALTATDALSGVARTAYRIDGGDWATVGAEKITVQGFGEHVVDFASTDVAGNPEVVHQQVVDLSDVDTVQALVAPQVTGTARYGGTLKATSGSWNTKGLTFTYQWLRDGRSISGARTTAYRLGASDVGERISVRVTATKAGRAPGTAVSAATAPVAKATSSTRLTVNRTTVKKGKPVRVGVTVVSTPRATGKVVVRVDGRAVRTVTLSGGRAAVDVVVRSKGTHQVTAGYAGSSVVAGSTSAARTIRVR